MFYKSLCLSLSLSLLSLSQILAINVLSCLSLSYTYNLPSLVLKGGHIKESDQGVWLTRLVSLCYLLRTLQKMHKNDHQILDEDQENNDVPLHHKHYISELNKSHD